MDRKRKIKNDFVFDKHKLKVINQYKKIKRKEAKSNVNFKHQKKPNFSDETSKRKDSMAVAIIKGKQIQQEKQKHKLEKQKRELNRQEKLKKRRRTHRKLSAKTPKGQPLMRNRMHFLLEKIQNNKQLYCPGKS